MMPIDVRDVRLAQSKDAGKVYLCSDKAAKHEEGPCPRCTQVNIPPRSQVFIQVGDPQFEPPADLAT